MALWSRWFGAGARLRAARQAELRGDTVRAAELYFAEGARADAARVILARGDSELDPRARLERYAQAASFAEPGSDLERHARARRAEVVVALAAGTPLLSALARSDLDAAARELEALGEPGRAGDAYRLLGDVDGEARCLEAAGEVERLEELLGRTMSRERDARDAQGQLADVELLLSDGRRREALALLDAMSEREGAHPAVGERAAALRARRVIGRVFSAIVDGAAIRVVLGDEVIVGRTEGDVTVAASAVSRRHLLIRASTSGVAVEDLGSRNGTHLRGVRIAERLELGAGEAELTLGKDVALSLGPSEVFVDGVRVAVAGQLVHAAVGGGRLRAAPWELALGSDGWLELRSQSGTAFRAGTAMAPSATLLDGDRIATARDGAALLVIGAP